MKNYKTPRLSRDGVIKGVSYVSYSAQNWLLSGLRVFVGFVLGACIVLALTGCATVTNGTSQTITFDVPEHQVCAVSRTGGVLGSVQASGPTLTVKRSRHPITLDCGDSVAVYEPSINAAGYTSIGLIDFGLVDSITGAMWEYKEVLK